MSDELDKTPYRIEALLDNPLSPKSLVGSHFLGRGGRAKGGWKGIIVAEPSPGIYLCELMEWIGFSYSHQELVRLEEMLDWRFYDTDEWCANDFKHGVDQLWQQERENENSA